MNRRAMIKSALAAIAAFLVPANTAETEFRRIFVGVPDGGFVRWERREFEQLRAGDVFFYADDGEETHYQATGEPFPGEPRGNYAIPAQRIKYVISPGKGIEGA